MDRYKSISVLLGYLVIFTEANHWKETGTNSPYSIMENPDIDVKKAIEDSQIVPDVIDKAPSQIVSVQYPGNLSVNLGNVLTVREVEPEPVLITWSVDPEKLYLLCMVDPDAPSRESPTIKEGRHYIVMNIPGNNISKGRVLTEYRGSKPPQNTGLHRYIFLVYEQSHLITDVSEPWLVNGDGNGQRAYFSTRKFAEKYKLGQPIAANYFQASAEQTA